MLLWELGRGSIELGVEALSGLSEVMILANLMSRLTWPKKKQQPSCKDSKVHVGFHCARNSRICFVDKALKKATSWGHNSQPFLFICRTQKNTKKGKANQTQTHPISEMLKCRCMDLAQHA